MTERILAFESFIDELARTETPPDLYNHYAYGPEENAIRRQNLLLYLKQMDRLRPRLLLVGEAPGYRGSRLTGVPFTSEHLLTHNIQGLALFGKEQGYQLPEQGGLLRKEATATIIWETLVEIGEYALGWNAIPFHPHKPGNAQSNRTPTRGELLLGEPHLLAMLELFPAVRVVAVGNKAADSLTKIGVAHQKVRHPAQGGKRLFVQGMLQVKRDLDK